MHFFRAQKFDRELRILMCRHGFRFNLDCRCRHTSVEQRLTVYFVIAGAGNNDARCKMSLEQFRRALWPLVVPAAKHDNDICRNQTTV